MLNQAEQPPAPHSLSSSDPLSVCPLGLEKPNGESNFCLRATTSLAQGELRMDPGRGGPRVPPGRVWVMVKGCRGEISFIICFALQSSLGRSCCWWWMEVRSQDLPITGTKAALFCALWDGQSPLTRDVSLGNTWYVDIYLLSKVPNQPGASYK